MADQELRDFTDMGTARNWLYDNTTQAIKESFPYENDNYRIEVSNVQVKHKDYDLDKQKQALLHNRPLRVPVAGTVRLIDKKAGKVIDERKGAIMHLPYLTDRGTFIYNGNEYSNIAQSRLKPGVYTRIRKSGEPEAFFNVAPRTGKTFRMIMHPETGVIKVNVGQANIPAYSFLKSLGATDDELKRVWGKELYHTNASAARPDDHRKLYERFVGWRGKEGAGPEEQQAHMREVLSTAGIDPDVVSRTLGVPKFKGVDKNVVMRATQKMYNIMHGTEKPDDRDAPKYSNILSVEDLIPERVKLDAGNLRRTLLWKAGRAKSLQKLPASMLTPYADDYMFGSRLTMPLEETNPLSLIEQMHRVTKLGEGGISSSESVTDEARDVNPGQLGFVDPIMGPESENIGIDVRTAFRTFKGRDRQMYAEFTDPATGKTVYRKPEDLDNKVIAFPGEMGRKDKRTVTALKDGDIREVSRKDVDYAVPSFAHMMAPHFLLNPMPTGFQPARAFYAAKFWSQYMPQVKGEAPLVDSLMPGSDKTFTQHYGQMLGTLPSPVDGVVKAVSDNAVTIQGADGKTYRKQLVKDFPFNRLSGISYHPAVKPGDPVKAGDMIAHSDFTDKTGTATLGQNLRTAIVPYRGRTYEDAYLISESAAKRLATKRLYGVDREAKHGVELGRDRFISLFPDQFKKPQLEHIDEHGIAKPGSILQKGDPIILATGPKLLGPEDMQLGRLHKTLRHAATDKSIVWDHDYPGRVVDAVRTHSGAKVNITADVPVKVGDKLAGRYGLKGVVGTILSDDEMPRNAATNEPYELLMNPMGVLSRVAPAKLAEIALGKIAKATGKRMLLPQEPPEEGWNQWTLNLMKKHGIPETDVLFDPKLQRNLPPVATGMTYLMAFHHLGEKKLSDRGSSGVGYTADEQPAKGGSDSAQAKRMSQMDINALLAHGAPDVIKDTQVIRGAKNDDYWRALKMGLPLPEPKVPFVYNKFLNLLKAGGINIRDKGGTLQLLPMTDDDVSRLSKGAIENSGLINDKMQPIPGGLFDPGKTGGLPGRNWSHIELDEPVPNPVFEEPIRRILGLKKKELRDIITGTAEYHGLRGGAAIKKALEQVDMDKEMAQAKYDIRHKRGSTRDDAVKRYNYLHAAKKQGIHPSKWVISKVPVLPPVFRPVSRMGDVTLQADLNELYRDLAESNVALKALKQDLPDDKLAEERANLYDAVSAAYGLGDPITPEGRSRRLKGAIHQIIGDQPKRGLFQSRVLSKTVDVVGRGVVTPDPNLDMDSVGIPEDSAWKLYGDFVMRRLKRRGIPTVKAMQLIKDRDPQAKSALLDEMKHRPVLMDRAPTWHKFNIMAFYPHIYDGKTVRVSPLVTKGFTMDFDGDTVNFHVPVSDKAVDQAKEKMLPSKNLLSLTDLQSIRHSPQQEIGLGIYQLTQEPSKKAPVRFRTQQEAVRAYREGRIKVNDPIVIG